MDDARARDNGYLAMAVGAVAAGSAVCLASYFIVGGPLGTMNDIGNAATGVLSGWLAWRLRRHVDHPAGNLAVGAALVGAVISVVGSTLVISGTTGFMFAGLVSSLGLAGIGGWLVVVNRSRGRPETWPRNVHRLGVAAGALMAMGVATVPGILLGLDDMATAPAWVWIGFLSWLGTYVVYPTWAIRVGLVETRRATGAAVTPATSGVTE